MVKTWGDRKTLDYNTCVFYLEKNEIPLKKQEKKFNSSKKYRYEMEESFGFTTKLWDEVIRYGFNPLHKLIRCAENMCKMSEHKFAMLNFPCQSVGKEKNSKNSKQTALGYARNHFKQEFRNKLGLKYFEPDPKHGGNSNTGPVIR